MFYLITVQNGNTPSILGYESHDAALAALFTQNWLTGMKIEQAHAV